MKIGLFGSSNEAKKTTEQKTQAHTITTDELEAAAEELRLKRQMEEALESGGKVGDDNMTIGAAEDLSKAIAEAEARRIAAAEALKAAEAAQAAAEEAERLAEEARIEAEIRAAEEEMARLEAEAKAAEEAARLEAERLEAERLAAEEEARIEAEIKAAEEEIARLEAEAKAAAEAPKQDETPNTYGGTPVSALSPEERQPLAGERAFPDDEEEDKNARANRLGARKGLLGVHRAPEEVKTQPEEVIAKAAKGQKAARSITLSVDDLKKFDREELIELLVSQTQRADRLEKELTRLKEEMDNMTIGAAEVGTLSEAALRLNHIFEDADRAARIYLENIRRRHE